MQYKLVALATLCGHGRCAVHRDPYAKDEITYMPEPEGSPRLTKQLFHLGIALMAVHEKNEITNYIYSVLVKVGLDLIPRLRFNIIKHLWESRALQGTGYSLSTTDVAKGTGIQRENVPESLTGHEHYRDDKR